MKRFVLPYLLLVSTLVYFSSCSKDDDCVTSDSCNMIPYDSGYVTLKVSYVPGGPGIPATLYEGYVEDNQVLWQDTLYQEEVVFYLPDQTRYAAEAYYMSGGQPLIALDGNKLKPNTSKDCGATCYEESNLSLDCRKY